MKTILIDGKYFLYRSLTAQFKPHHKEVITATYYGFLQSMRTLTRVLNPDNLIIMWDSNYSYRREIYPDYKRKDKKPNDTILEQLKIISEEYEKLKIEMSKLGFASHIRYGLEADDLFAIYKNQFKDEQIIIASRDSDLYQLIEDKRVMIYDPHSKIKKNAKWFSKEYGGLSINDWIMVKVYAGCISDNIKGIESIGEKTAIKYLQGTSSTKTISKILENNEIIQRNLKLIKLPYQNRKKEPLNMKEKRTCLDMDAFIFLCQNMGFKSFLEEFNSFDVLKFNR